MKALAAFRALAAREAGSAWRGGEGPVDRGLAAGGYLLAVLVVWASVEGDSEAARAYAVREAASWLFGWVLLGVAALGPVGFVRLLARDRDRGVLDLLLLSPVPSAALLFAKAAGRTAGFAAALAAGLPALFVLLPLGGISLGELVSLQAVVVAFVLAVGGLSVFLASVFRGLAAALVATWLVLGLWLGGPSLLRSVGASPLLVGWSEALSFSADVDRELAGVFADPSAALRSLGAGLGILVAGCLAGGLLLRRRHTVGRAAGLVERLVSAIRARSARAAAAPRWAKWFRPIVPSKHALVRRESLVGRDFAFRVGWLAFALVSGVAAMVLLFFAEFDQLERHLGAAVLGFAAALSIAALHGVVSFGTARRRGQLEVYLSANLEPDEILRARAGAVSLRALFLALPWLAYAALATAWWGPGRNLLGEAVRAAVGAGLAIAAVGPFTMAAAVAFRRTVLAAAEALLLVGVALWVGGILAVAWPVLAIGGPVLVGGLLAVQARSARRFRTAVLR